MQEHRETPAGVIESAAARLRRAGVVDGDDVVAEALATIDTTDSAWNVLRVICEGRSDSARYAALRSDSRLDFGRSRLSQCLSTLVEADLVFTEGPRTTSTQLPPQPGRPRRRARFGYRPANRTRTTSKMKVLGDPSKQS